MRIVSRETFMTLPAGTVYCEYEPCIFGNWLIKGQTIVSDGENIDWFYDASLDSLDAGDLFETLDTMTAQGTSTTVDFYQGGRDGCFAWEQLYAVYEQADLKGLIKRLQEAETEAFGVAQ